MVSEQWVWGNAGYQGIEDREEHEGGDVEWMIGMRPGICRTLPEDSAEVQVGYLKAQIRVKVEHPFRYLKQMFGYSTVRYPGPSKNSV